MINLTEKQLKVIIKEEMENLLNEAGTDEWGWNKAPDNDFQFDTDLYKNNRSSRTMVFTQDATDYEENSEFTHGAMSHALKHFGEWDLPRVIKDIRSIFNMIKGTLKAKNQQFWFMNKGNPQLTSGQIGDIKVGDVGNTIDMVNDKFLEGKDLLPIEKKIYRKAKSMTNAYNEDARKIEKEAFDLSDANIKNYKELEHILRRERYVKFRVSEPSRNHLSSVHIIDLKKGIRVIVLSNGNIATTYKIAGDDRKRGEVLKDYIKDQKLEQVPGQSIFNLRMSAAYEAAPKLQQDFSDPDSVAELIKLNKQRKKFAYDPEKSDAINRASQRIEKSLSKLDKQRWNNLKLQSKNRSKIVDPVDPLKPPVPGYDPMLPSKGWPASVRNVPIEKWPKSDQKGYDSIEFRQSPYQRDLTRYGVGGILRDFNTQFAPEPDRIPRGANPRDEYDQLYNWLNTYGAAELSAPDRGKWKKGKDNKSLENYLMRMGREDAKAKKPKRSYKSGHGLEKVLPNAQEIYDTAYDEKAKSMNKGDPFADILQQTANPNKEVDIVTLRNAMKTSGIKSMIGMTNANDQAISGQATGRGYKVTGVQQAAPRKKRKGKRKR